MEPTYSPLVYKHDWGTTVHLNNEPLTHGTMVEILYPDGETEIERIEMRVRSTNEVEQGGGTWLCTTEEAGVLIDYHGIRTWIKLPSDTLMRRVTIKAIL